MDSIKAFNNPVGALIPDKKAAAMLGVCVRTLRNREKEDPDFPAAVEINGRLYRGQANLEKKSMNCC